MLKLSAEGAVGPRQQVAPVRPVCTAGVGAGEHDPVLPLAVDAAGFEPPAADRWRAPAVVDAEAGPVPVAAVGGPHCLAGPPRIYADPRLTVRQPPIQVQV